jgi:site-specific recombinase XerD
MKRWDGLKDRFMEAYETRGLAGTTVEMMSGEWDRWGCWLKNRKPRPKLEEVTVEMVTAYISSRCQFHAKSTQRGVMSRMRAIGDFLVEAGLWRTNFLRWMQGPKVDIRHRLPRRVDKSSLARLLEAAATSRYKFSRYLWSAIISVLYGTGIRRGELSRLTVSSWDSTTGLLRIDGSKGRRERSVPLPPLAWQCLEAYLPRRQNLLASRQIFHEEALFITNEGTRLDPNRLSQGMGHLTRRAGVRMTMHQLRHTCASDLIADGVKLPHVQKLLGHKSVSTTMRYLHLAGPELAKAMERHPICHLGQLLSADNRKRKTQFFKECVDG